MQDLLDTFGKDAGADTGPVDEAGADADASSGFAEAKVLPDGEEAAGEADRWA